MRRRAGWLAVMVVAFGMFVGSGRAADVPPAQPPTALPSEAQCTAACGQLIDQCTGVFGPAMGDMRPYCTKAVIRRCRSSGLVACEAAAREAR